MTGLRLSLMICVLTAVALLATTGAASGAGKKGKAGGTYVVVQCHPQNLEAADAQLREPRPYGITRGCADVASENAMRINSRLAAEPGRRGSISWIAPPDTAFVRVRAEAKLRRDAGHYARLYMADHSGRETRRIATGDGSPGAFHQELWEGNRQARFVAALGCDEPNGCPQSEAAKTWVRGLRMTLADYSNPEVQVSGSLLSGGWKRGDRQVTSSGQDLGSGMHELVIQVNGLRLGESVDGVCSGPLSSGGLATRLRPCELEIGTQTKDASTDAAPFRDGANAVAICAFDFAENQACVHQQVNVDNTSPMLAFRSPQDSEDPELIRAVVADAHSGVAGGQILYRPEGTTLWQPLETVLVAGELRARVDSTSVPAGWYEFRATATDVAGNQTETTQRQDGSTMRLEFPLRTDVDLNAGLKPGGSKRVTVRYGRRSMVAGVLREAAGAPIAGQEIVIEEFFGDGALIRERVTRVRTDGHGRWKSKLPAGPSRRVTATYAGSPRYLPESTLGGRLAVRTQATLRTSKRRVPEGGRVVFRGKLGRLGARIPPGGKLLELQVRQDKRTYQTVGQGFRSRSSGRYKVPYRFGDFYQYDIRFKFRIRVAREADWPYKAPVRSRGRTVTVLDR